jgi:hypothetical protein
MIALAKLSALSFLIPSTLAAVIPWSAPPVGWFTEGLEVRIHLQDPLAFLTPPM